MEHQTRARREKLHNKKGQFIVLVWESIVIFIVVVVLFASLIYTLFFSPGKQFYLLMALFTLLRTYVHVVVFVVIVPFSTHFYFCVIVPLYTIYLFYWINFCHYTKLYFISCLFFLLLPVFFTRETKTDYQNV